MYVTVFTFRASPGKEEAVVDLFEAWERDRMPAAKGFVASELLRDAGDPSSFISIARFESEAALRALAATPEQDAWYRDLVSLTLREPVFTDCEVEWSTR
jgi:quinol monooxygenase YgiN